MYDPATGRNGWRATAAQLQPAFDAAAQAAAEQQAADAAAKARARVLAIQQAPIVAAMRRIMVDFSATIKPYWANVMRVYGPGGPRCGKTLASGVTVSARENRQDPSLRSRSHVYEYLELRFYLCGAGWHNPDYLIVSTWGSWMFASEVETGNTLGFQPYFSCSDLPKLERVVGVGQPAHVSMTEYCLTSFFMDAGIPLPA